MSKVKDALKLMKDNEVQYSICWSGRVVGDPAFGLSFAGGKADLSFICVVKGSKPEDHHDPCLRLRNRAAHEKHIGTDLISGPEPRPRKIERD